MEAETTMEPCRRVRSSSTEINLEQMIHRAAHRIYRGLWMEPEWDKEFSLLHMDRIREKVEELRRQSLGRARSERRAKKAKIRAMTRGHEQKPCAACGASKLISVQHHVHLVANSSPEDPNCDRYVWLCPNCHATIHILERKGTDANLEDLFDELVREGLLEGDKGRVLADIFIEMVAAAEAKGDA